jgi:hypothetical protein
MYVHLERACLILWDMNKKVVMSYILGRREYIIMYLHCIILFIYGISLMHHPSSAIV